MLGDDRNYLTSTSMFGQATTPSSEAAVALERKGKETVLPLIELLEHGTNSWARSKAAPILGHTKDPRAVPSLIAALRDQDWIVRRSAASALCEMHDSIATEPLIETLKDSNSAVRFEAAAALRYCCINDPRIIGPLKTLLNDESCNVRMVAASVLGEVKSKGNKNNN